MTELMEYALDRGITTKRPRKARKANLEMNNRPYPGYSTPYPLKVLDAVSILDKASITYGITQQVSIEGNHLTYQTEVGTFGQSR